MRELVRLPHEMTPAVLQIIGLERWRDADDPLDAIRSDAIEAHRRAWVKGGASQPTYYAGAVKIM